MLVSFMSKTMTNTHTSNTRDHESAREDEGVWAAYEVILMKKGTKYHSQCDWSLLKGWVGPDGIHDFTYKVNQRASGRIRRDGHQPVQKRQPYNGIPHTHPLPVHREKKNILSHKRCGIRTISSNTISHIRCGIRSERVKGETRDRIS